MISHRRTYRNIDFYCSRNSDLSLDKSRFLDEFEENYDVQRGEIFSKMSSTNYFKIPKCAKISELFMMRLNVQISSDFF